MIADPEGPITEFALEGEGYRLVATHHGRATPAFGPTIALPSA